MQVWCAAQEDSSIAEVPRDSLVLVCYNVGFQTCVVPVCADWHLRWAVAVCDRGISITFGL